MPAGTLEFRCVKRLILMKIRDITDIFSQAIKDCDMCENEIKNDIKALLDDIRLNINNHDKTDILRTRVCSLETDLLSVSCINDMVFEIYRDLVRKKRLTMKSYENCKAAVYGYVDMRCHRPAFHQAGDAINLCMRKYEKCISFFIGWRIIGSTYILTNKFFDKAIYYLYFDRKDKNN